MRMVFLWTRITTGNEREEFEVFARTIGWEDKHFTKVVGKPNLYDDWGVQPMWMAWQASRAALVVELPPAMHNYYGDLMTEQDGAAKELCDLLDIDEVREALTKAGVTVK